MNYTVTAKLQIMVPKDDKITLLETMEAYRKACNFVSDYCFRTHDLKQFHINTMLYYDVRAKFGLGAQMAQSVIKTVIAKYKTILENQREWIKPVFSKPQLDLVWNRDYSLNKKQFSVGTCVGRRKLPFRMDAMEKYFDGTWKFGTAKLVYKHGKFFLHLPVTREMEETCPSGIVNVVGIDRGINFVAATYNPAHKSGFVSGKQIKQTRGHYRTVRKQLQMVHTPSSRRRLKAIGSRENRWMQDVNHCVSKALVESNPENTLFVLEDLSGVRNATERVRVKDRYVTVSWSFYDLERKLKYKAAAKRQAVINVPPQYTSQTCPVCGHIDPLNRNKKMHSFCCRNCGYRSNDDRIGAMNLHRMGIEYLVQAQTAAEQLV